MSISEVVIKVIFFPSLSAHYLNMIFYERVLYYVNNKTKLKRKRSKVGLNNVHKRKREDNADKKF